MGVFACESRGTFLFLVNMVNGYIVYTKNGSLLSFAKYIVIWLEESTRFIDDYSDLFKLEKKFIGNNIDNFISTIPNELSKCSLGEKKGGYISIQVNAPLKRLTNEKMNEILHNLVPKGRFPISYKDNCRYYEITCEGLMHDINGLGPNEKYRNIYFPDLNLDLKEVIDVIKFNKKGFITRTDIILYILYLLNE